MKIKLISAAIATILIFSTCSVSFASTFNDVQQKFENIEQAREEQKKEQNETNSEIKSGSDDDFIYEMLEHPTTADIYYKIFDNIMDAYIEKHLYEFEKDELVSKFIYDLIKTHPELYNTMIDTLLGTMDKYSALHTKESGFLSIASPNAGFGIVVAQNEETAVIEKVLKDSEAEAAGILPGDIIKNVMGYDVSNLPWFAVSMMLKRPYLFIGNKLEDGKYEDYNPPVSFVVERDGVQLEFSFGKGIMNMDELSYSYYEDEGVAYVQISSFISEDLPSDFKKLIYGIAASGTKKLIIDLRDNGGGNVEYCLSMAELFVDEGETLCYFNAKTLEKPEPILSTNGKIAFDSISVLVNENTASAAELMASILRNKCGAILVGQTTYGKMLGQNVYTLATGDYITITTYEMLDANGESYEGEGLVPDLVLDNVKVLYEMPELLIFNHVNYKEIVPGVYNDACLALEQRLEMMGYLLPSSVDGIWDDDTKTTLYILQVVNNISGDGTLNDGTVTLITDLINSYKEYTFYEDSQLDVALITHSSFSQGKRLIIEKQRLALQQAKLIEERFAYLEEITP